MRYIAAVDQSTSASKAFLVDQRGEIVRRASRQHKQYYPAPGRVEHDAQEIYENVVAILEEVMRGISPSEIAALAITNQRETTILWDAKTEKPVCPAIVWQDVRGESACRELADSAERVHEITGLTLSPYFAAGKLRALFRENPALLERARNGEIKIGTVDSYLIYRMTGCHRTDTTNASRTQLMDLNTLQWSDELLELFGIPACAMADEILPADAVFGEYKGIPITGVLGDSHAALFGQGCHRCGMAKATYGTGSSVMMNVGFEPRISHEGLSASVAYSAFGKTHYALEGNITCSGDTLVWLCDTLGLFENPEEIETLAKTVVNADGVALVPAFTGLGAPYFDSDARALICGMSRGTGKAQIAYAALESIAQQDADVLEVMRRESGYAVTDLHADGGPTKNAILMQLQADLTGSRICCAAASELSALGAAYLAGIRRGVFKDYASIDAVSAARKNYEPLIDAQERSLRRQQWRTAVKRALRR